MTKSLTADGGFRPSANHKHALDSAIGIRSSDHRSQPDLPHMVRSPQVAGSLTGSIVLNSMYGEGMGQFSHSQMDPHGNGGMFQNSVSTAGTHGYGHGHGGKGSPVRGGLALEQSYSSGYDANEVRSAIAERERHFFKEVSLNPNLKDQHPLMHLISAQQKLKLIDEQSGVLASKTANKSESIFGTRYGKQSADKFMKNGAYAAEIPYAINGEIILPSKLKQRKQEELRMSKSKKSQSLKMLLNPGSLKVGDQTFDGTGADAASIKSTRSFASSNDPNAKASQNHRNFLLESLKRIEGAAAASESYVGHYTGNLDDRAAAASPSSKAPFGISPSGKVRSPSSRTPKASSTKSISSAAYSVQGAAETGTSDITQSGSSEVTSHMDREPAQLLNTDEYLPILSSPTDGEDMNFALTSEV